MATLSSPALQDLLSTVRSLLSSPDPNNSFWSDVELTSYLNEAIRIYFAEVAQHNEGLFTTTTGLNIAANTETVALPSDCFRVKNLWKTITNGYALLEYRNSVSEGYTSQGGTSANSYFPYYYFQGNNIVLRPTPNFSETNGLKLEYLQFPTQLLNAGDSLTAQVSPVFKQVIEMYAVYKAKLKESLTQGVNVHTVAESNLATLVSQFRDSIKVRSTTPTGTLPFNPEFI